MKKPKTTSGAAKPPQTDAEALLDIVVWSADRPPWQRQALRYLLLEEQLTPEQFEVLYQQTVDSKPSTAPLAETDVRSPQAQAAAVSLKSVSNPQDVNALASDQTLSVEKTGLTIIYGDNGAGKSGYARILKHACRARIDAKAPAILPNIYSQAAGTPRAKIAFVVNTQHKRTDWRFDDSSPPGLSAISVFDARTANVHVDGTNEVAYLPSSLELLQRLAKAADTIRDRARQAKATIEAQTPQALRKPPIDAATSVARALAQLAPTSDYAALETTAKLSEHDVAKLADLKRDLSAEPAKAARQLAEVRAGLSRFATTISGLCVESSSARLAEIKALYSRRLHTRAAADAAAQNRFSTEPLPLVGSEAWRALWEAARRYATADAQPGRPFPPSTADAHCLLCQQPLSDVALDRFARFEAFVRDDTKRQADLAEKVYNDRLAAMTAAFMPMRRLRQSLRYVADTLGDRHTYEATRAVAIAARWQLRRVIRAHAMSELEVADIEPTMALAELQHLIDGLQKGEAALLASADSAERKALEAELRELEARAWLATVLPDRPEEAARAPRSRHLGSRYARHYSESRTIGRMPHH